MSTRDEVSLSSNERQLLAQLEARARSDDPSLAARLRGRRRAALVARWREIAPGSVPGWTGPVAVVAGLLVTLVALSGVIWLSVLGLALCVAGGCRVGISVRDRRDARTEPPPAPPGG
ncbi:MAG: DUF3040 domain-containing protein [Acidimicrobiales bacterium]